VPPARLHPAPVSVETSFPVSYSPPEKTIPALLPTKNVEEAGKPKIRPIGLDFLSIVGKLMVMKASHN